MDLVSVKVLVLILLGLIKLGSGLLPILLDKVLQIKKAKWLEKFMSGMLCIGGGVLLATVFIHMIPEVRESLASARKLSNDDDEHEDEHHYPVAELVVCAGFFIIYAIEALVHRIFGLNHHSHGAIPVKNEVQMENGIDNTAFANETMDGPIRSPPDTPDTTGGSAAPPKTICSPVTSEDNHPDTVHANASPFGFKFKYSSSKLATSAGSGGPRNVYNVSSATLTSYTSYADGDSLDASLPNHLGLPVVKQKRRLGIDREKKILSYVRNFLIVLSLSIHSVFEGMAIGLQLNNSDVWKLFAAVSIHACAILFCIGTEMIAMGTKRLQIIFYMVTLAFVTPLGVVIGMIVTEYVDEQSPMQTLVIGLLQGLAGGTLLYITFFEVLDKEKLSKLGMSSFTGCILIILGFGIMAGLEAAGGHSHGIVGHEHDHHEHHNHHNHLPNPIILSDEELKGIDPRLPNILNHAHDHDHDDHDHEDHDHEDHEHEDHEHEEHEHEEHEHEEHDHEEHDHEEHDHDDHGEETKTYFPVPIRSKA